MALQLNIQNLDAPIKNKYKLYKHYYYLIKNINLDIKTKQKLLLDTQLDDDYLVKICSDNILKSCELVCECCKKFTIDQLSVINPRLKSILIELRCVCVYVNLINTFDILKKDKYEDRLSSEIQLQILDKLYESFNTPFKYNEDEHNYHYKKLIDEEWWQSKQEMFIGIIRHMKASIDVKDLISFVVGVYNTGNIPLLDYNTNK